MMSYQNAIKLGNFCAIIHFSYNFLFYFYTSSFQLCVVLRSRRYDDDDSQNNNTDADHDDREDDADESDFDYQLKQPVRVLHVLITYVYSLKDTLETWFTYAMRGWLIFTTTSCVIHLK